MQSSVMHAFMHIHTWIHPCMYLHARTHAMHAWTNPCLHARCFYRCASSTYVYIHMHVQSVVVFNHVFVFYVCVCLFTCLRICHWFRCFSRSWVCVLCLLLGCPFLCYVMFVCSPHLCLVIYFSRCNSVSSMFLLYCPLSIFHCFPRYILDPSSVHPRSILDPSSIHPRSILDPSSIHPRSILDQSPIHPRSIDVLGIIHRCIGHHSKMYWASFIDVLGIIQTCIGHHS